MSDENEAAIDESDEFDDEDDETGVSGELFVQLGKSKTLRLVPLALTICDNIPPVVVDGQSLAWTREAVAAFGALRDDARRRDPDFERSLPYASLRGLLEVALNNVSRLLTGVGLHHRYLGRSTQWPPEPFAFLEGGEPAQTAEVLRPILQDWIINYLIPCYTDPGHIATRLKQAVLDLWEENGLLNIQPFGIQALPWDWTAQTGTTKPTDRRAYRLLADHAARLLAGKEIFPGLGPMRRIVTTAVATSSMAELISWPIHVDDERGDFSLVITLEVVTFPGLHQPLLTMNVSKRLWLRGLSEQRYDRRAINGAMFSEDHADRAFTFRLARKRGGGVADSWSHDSAFEVLRRILRLPLGPVDGSAIARGEASSDRCRVLLTHRETIGEGTHGIKLGVPELDKLTAFDRVTEILKNLGMKPFDGYVKVKTPDRSSDVGSRMINAPTLLGSALEALETGDVEHLTPSYLKTLSPDQIDALLRRHFQLGLQVIQHGMRLVQFQNKWGQPEKDQLAALDTLVDMNRVAVDRMYPGERPLLVIFYEEGAAAHLPLLQSILHVLWGGALEVIANRLPANTHGPRLALPVQEGRPIDRFESRIASWQPIAQQLQRMGRRVFCLVMAREFYSDPNNGKTFKHDDKVNKPATRQALAALAGASVQFLLPPEILRLTGAINLGNFFHRVQAAMKDLISAHSGRIDGIREKVQLCLGRTEESRRSMPRQILGITIVRKNRGRDYGLDSTFLPIAIRIDVETGRCDMRCAFDLKGKLTLTPWEHFPDALVTVSRISPVKLADRQDVAKTRFMEFVSQVISGAVEESAQPVVMIDSTNCAALWGWLRDQDIDATKIDIGSRQWMQDEWQGARIVRIRRDLAPRIVEDKEKRLAHTFPADIRLAATLSPDRTLPAPSSPVGLFRLKSIKDTGCISYLSVGRKTLLMKSRGPSCYRRIEKVVPYRVRENGKDLVQKNAAGAPMLGVVSQNPWVDQWPSPNPLEIVVALRQPQDDPNRVAELVESLRYGFGHYSEWTSLPAPLFFERVVRGYISGFALDDDTDEDRETTDPG